MAWDLLAENFNDLTDWTDNDYGNGVSEISPAGQLHQDSSATTTSIARIYQDIGTISTGDYTVLFKFKFDILPTTETTQKLFYIEINAGTNQSRVYLTKGTAQTYGAGGYNTLITKAWALDTWYTIRAIIHNSQTDMDVYLDEVLETSDADVALGAGTDGLTYVRTNPWQQEQAEWHVDYIYIGAGQQVPSTTSIKKVSGVEHASIKKIGGVAIGDVKKISGVE